MDELQNIWHAHSGQVTNKQHLNKEQLKERLIKKADDALRKINRVMRVDALIMVVVTALFIAITFMIDLESKYIVSLLLLAMMVFLGLHYWVKYYLINKHDFQDENIATIISKKVKWLTWSRQAYLYGIPIFSFGLYLYLQTILMQIEFDALVFSDALLVRYSLGVPFAICIYIFTKWLYGRLYGNELRILKEVINELD